MYGLRSRIKKEKLLKSYKTLMKTATGLSQYNKLESKQLQEQAIRVLDEIEHLD